MVDQELIERVTQLPVDARLELIEVLTRSLRSNFSINIAEGAEVSERETVSPDRRINQPTPEERAAALNQMLGAASDNQSPSTQATLAAITERARILNLQVSPDSALHQLLGVAAPGVVPMTKDDTREMITDYLTEKYS